MDMLDSELTPTGRAVQTVAELINDHGSMTNLMGQYEVDEFAQTVVTKIRPHLLRETADALTDAGGEHPLIDSIRDRADDGEAGQ